MEIPHAHSHPTEHKKTWKNYLSEFLMLFLAVFCGFIAENAREHVADREKEHQYMSSMVRDIAKDTLELQRVMRINQKIIKKIDTLLTLIKAAPSDSVNQNIYKYSNYVSIYVIFNGSNGTMTQLKNAGGLRLIRDTAAVNRIAAYDTQNELTREQGEAYKKSSLDMLVFLTQMVDFSVIGTHSASGYYLNRSPEALREFYNKCYIQQKLIEVYCTVLKNQQSDAAKTMELLRKNYHLTE